MLSMAASVSKASYLVHISLDCAGMSLARVCRFAAMTKSVGSRNAMHVDGMQGEGRSETDDSRGAMLECAEKRLSRLCRMQAKLWVTTECKQNCGSLQNASKIVGHYRKMHCHQCTAVRGKPCAAKSLRMDFIPC